MYSMSIDITEITMATNRIEHLMETGPKKSADDDAFVICPSVFHEGLSDERFKAQQQLYEIAFRRAQLAIQARNQQSDFRDGGDGI